jgi:trehalose 6-phosphate synthase
MSGEPTRLVRPEASEGRLLLVSNRLPITIKRSDEGKYDMSMSSGGLVSGLSGLAKTTTFQWYGWPGLEVPEDEAKGLNDQLKEKYNAVPVMLDDELADRHYNGFSSEAHCPTASFLVLTTRRRDHVAALPLPPR